MSLGTFGPAPRAGLADSSRTMRLSAIVALTAFLATAAPALAVQPTVSQPSTITVNGAPPSSATTTTLTPSTAPLETQTDTTARHSSLVSRAWHGVTGIVHIIVRPLARAALDEPALFRQAHPERAFLTPNLGLVVRRLVGVRPALEVLRLELGLDRRRR